ncbi:MAG: hypothetical protein K6F84_04420 [Lachnospiraceae bacterium]|nr:hypothetical protein [Lachnospiraceae bacterium]
MKERPIDKLLNAQFKILSYEMSGLDLCFMLAAFVIGAIIRVKIIDIQSADYYGFLEKWVDSMREGGGLKSLSQEITNYASAYTLYMTLISYLKASPLYMLKLFSYVFDFIAAFSAFALVHDITKDVKKSIGAFTLVILSPAALINSGWFCQCDIIYTCFLVMSFRSVYKGENTKSAVFLALSFMFKLQAVFFLPFYVIMWIKGKNISLVKLLYMPLVFFISVLPAWIFGGDPTRLLTIYFSQADYYPWGTLNYPNLYVFLDENMPDTTSRTDSLCGAGMWITLIVTGMIAYYICSKRIEMTGKVMMALLMFSVSCLTYFLPHMHDRYNFIFDIFVMIYVATDIKKLPLAALASLVTVLNYMVYLVGHSVMDPLYLAILNTVLLVLVGKELFDAVNEAPELKVEPVPVANTNK